MEDDWIIQNAEVGRRLQAALIPQASPAQVVAACPEVTLEELQKFMRGVGPLTQNQLREVAAFLKTSFTQLFLGEDAELRPDELQLLLQFRQLDQFDQGVVLRVAAGLGNMPK